MTPFTIALSRPTFAELTTMLSKMGLTDALSEDGKICIGNHHFVSNDGTLPSCGRAARVAAQIADASLCIQHDDSVYDKDGIRIVTRCKEDGVHLVRLNDHDNTSQGAILPYASLMPVAGDLIECLGKVPKIATCAQIPAPPM